jgi:hypothetical protein
MKRKQEYEFYAQAENQTPNGPARRHEQNLTEIVMVCLEADVLDEVRRRADADHRSVPAWIRRAAEQALRKTAS